MSVKAKMYTLLEARESAKAHYKKVMSRGKMAPLDKDAYPPIRGMEGPFRFKNGWVLYYDAREGKYYDRKQDRYLSDKEATKIVM